MGAGLAAHGGPLMDHGLLAYGGTIAYGGPPPPSAGGVLGAWVIDPVMLLVVLAAAAGYLYGVARVRRAGGTWPVGRTAAFLGLGLSSLVIVTMAWPGVYSRALFSVYAVQLMVLLMVTPFLLALGRPVALAKAALSPAGLTRFEAVLDSRPAKLFTVPVVSPLLLAVVPFALYFTPLYRLSLTSPVALALTHLVLLAVGVAVLVPLWEADAVNARFPYAVALLFAFIELLADAVPGIVIRLDTHVLAAGYYATLARPWGPSLLGDQQLGGDLLWCVGEAVDIPFLILLVISWVRSDAREAARIDALIDPGAAAEPGPAATPEPGPAVTPEPAVTRPWWESDASVFGDRARLYQRPGGRSSGRSSGRNGPTG